MIYLIGHFSWISILGKFELIKIGLIGGDTVKIARIFYMLSLPIFLGGCDQTNTKETNDNPEEKALAFNPAGIESGIENTPNFIRA